MRDELGAYLKDPKITSAGLRKAELEGQSTYRSPGRGFDQGEKFGAASEVRGLLNR